MVLQQGAHSGAPLQMDVSYIEGGHLGTALTVSMFYCSHTVHIAKAIQTQRVDIVVFAIRPILGRMFIVSAITINM